MHPLPVDLGSEFGLGLVQYFREGCAKFFDVDRWSCHGRTLAPLRNGPSVRPTAIEGRSPPFASDDRSSHPILGGLVGYRPTSLWPAPADWIAWDAKGDD